MSNFAFFLAVLAFGWYLSDVVYGEQQSIPLANSNAHIEQQGSIPELTEERIELLRRIAGLPIEDEASYVSATVKTSGTDNSITLTGSSAISSKLDAEINVRSVNSEWESYQGIDQDSNKKEGFAYSGWTTLSASHNLSHEKIQASLVVGCSEDGDRSLYVKTRSSYPGSESDRDTDVVSGLIGWDSSDPYDAPFTYDAGLNALRLRSGIEDSFSLIKAGNKVTIQFPWQEDNQAVFEFSLKGSSVAINDVFHYCTSNSN